MNVRPERVFDLLREVSVFYKIWVVVIFVQNILTTSYSNRTLCAFFVLFLFLWAD